MSAWSLVVAHGMRLIGVVDDGGVMTDPVELQISVGPDGQGGMRIGHSGTPVCMLPSLSTLGLPSDAIVVHRDQLSVRDMETIDAAYSQGQEMSVAIRAAQSGLSIAPKMPPQAGPSPHPRFSRVRT